MIEATSYHSPLCEYQPEAGEARKWDPKYRLKTEVKTVRLERAVRQLAEKVVMEGTEAGVMPEEETREKGKKNRAETEVNC